MEPKALYERWSRHGRAFGDVSRTLVMGPYSIELCGLSDELASLLGRRWGAFLRDEHSPPPNILAELCVDSGGGWLDPPSPGELYRLEAVGEPGRELVCSYHFAAARDASSGSWRISLSENPDEPIGRVLDNVCRLLTAHLAIDEGGFAMHAAGVLRDERAWLLAGASGSGKTTAVGITGAPTLGDDFAFVVRDRGTFKAPATPFDNAERIDHRPPEGLFPVAGVWRLYQAPETRVERVPAALEIASLMGCVAFPWAVPSRNQELIDHVARFVRESRFRHLHFARDADLWTHLL